MTKKVIQNGLIISGLVNITGVLFFSKLFTNVYLTTLQPDVFSYFGLWMIFVWGLLFISISKKYENLKYLFIVLALEKMSYVYSFIDWHLHNNISDVYSKDTITGIFFSIYGINDFIFMVFYILIFIKLNNKN